MNKIRERLYLGSVGDLTQLGDVTAVMSCSPEFSTDKIAHWCGGRKRRFVDIDDGEEIPAHWLESAILNIQNWLKDGETVLVHCAAGISRSPSIIIAYLMYSENISWDAALQDVQFARPIVYPHPEVKRSVLKYLKAFPYNGQFGEGLDD